MSKRELLLEDHGEQNKYFSEWYKFKPWILNVKDKPIRKITVEVEYQDDEITGAVFSLYELEWEGVSFVATDKDGLY